MLTLRAQWNWIVTYLFIQSCLYTILKTVSIRRQKENYLSAKCQRNTNLVYGYDHIGPTAVPGAGPHRIWPWFLLTYFHQKNILTGVKLTITQWERHAVNFDRSTLSVTRSNRIAKRQSNATSVLRTSDRRLVSKCKFIYSRNVNKMCWIWGAKSICRLYDGDLPHHSYRVTAIVRVQPETDDLSVSDCCVCVVLLRTVLNCNYVA